MANHLASKNEDKEEKRDTTSWKEYLLRAAAQMIQSTLKELKAVA